MKHFMRLACAFLIIEQSHSMIAMDKQKLELEKLNRDLDNYIDLLCLYSNKDYNSEENRKNEKDMQERLHGINKNLQASKKDVRIPTAQKDQTK